MVTIAKNINIQAKLNVQELGFNSAYRCIVVVQYEADISCRQKLRFNLEYAVYTTTRGKHTNAAQGQKMTFCQPCVRRQFQSKMHFCHLVWRQFQTGTTILARFPTRCTDEMHFCLQLQRRCRLNQEQCCGSGIRIQTKGTGS